MKTLVLGGTRFVGKALVSLLSSKGYELTLFTRGSRPCPKQFEHIKGDRTTDEGLKLLQGRRFDVIIDTSGRRLEETKNVLSITGAPKHRFLYVSSAGVYNNSIFWPIDEGFSIDSNSRHIGKAQTEQWLIDQNIPFTSFRPTYIYGPGNYNPIERWFFDRIIHKRPVPIPGNGNWVTQLGHVQDLADAMTKSLDFDIARNRIYNCSGKKGVTFLGLIELAARACGKEISQIDIRSFNPSGLDPKARKAFPLRIDHFLTDITRIQEDLRWTPKYQLEEGLLDSFNNDYLLNANSEPDFSSDDALMGN
ncbi:NAD-dependent epimerase/dehydratase family protein [Prochlorococcus sp. MIT 1307]|uniref:NAD-dependent epimerase/dehydratase family protein n=1 Tax=Prochlorococcus sp. MIT 1307 TaxID=3096219 RepID=UPI002A74DAD4|nr:NAD-dependent epimerase/dehydratase family protein [Prochlorococcus sp. MIT 1307]